VRPVPFVGFWFIIIMILKTEYCNDYYSAEEALPRCGLSKKVPKGSGAKA